MWSQYSKESQSMRPRKDLKFYQDSRQEQKERGEEAKLQLLQWQRRKDLKNDFIYPAKKSAVLRGKLVQFYLILNLAKAGSEG